MRNRRFGLRGAPGIAIVHPMNAFDDAMEELRSCGTEKNRAVYARHGVRTPMFGVSFAALGKMAKRLKRNGPLAEALWDSGNHDARILATMVADPATCGAKTLRKWARESGNHVVAGAVAKAAAASPEGAVLAAEWIDSADEWVGTCGWDATAAMADAIPEAVAAGLLRRIEREIAGAPNRVRYSMNGALVAIGARGGALRDAAVAAARRIGKVEVDHGETGCATPDAESYIAKTLAYREGKKAKKRAGNGAGRARR